MKWRCIVASMIERPLQCAGFKVTDQKTGKSQENCNVQQVLAEVTTWNIADNMIIGGHWKDCCAWVSSPPEEAAGQLLLGRLPPGSCCRRHLPLGGQLLPGCLRLHRLPPLPLLRRAPQQQGHRG
ncbi:hypothetical protein SEVIR_1G238050v4 [Setaria viridis]